MKSETQNKISPEMKARIKNEIRGYMIAQGHTNETLAKLITEKCGRVESPQNISNKLQRGAIKYAEVLEIAEALGYQVKWDKM